MNYLFLFALFIIIITSCKTRFDSTYPHSNISYECDTLKNIFFKNDSSFYTSWHDDASRCNGFRYSIYRDYHLQKLLIGQTLDCVLETLGEPDSKQFTSREGQATIYFFTYDLSASTCPDVITARSIIVYFNEVQQVDGVYLGIE